MKFLDELSGEGRTIVMVTHDLRLAQRAKRALRLVKCTFVFTNVGDQVLEVTNVQASCGCTTAGEWSRKVEPGQIGSIPIQFNGANFSGQVAKSITVSCNDPNQPTVGLQIKATIWKPIDVAPQFAILNVSAESPSNATTVRIVNNEETPLTLSADPLRAGGYGARN